MNSEHYTLQETKTRTRTRTSPRSSETTTQKREKPSKGYLYNHPRPPFSPQVPNTPFNCTFARYPDPVRKQTQFFDVVSCSREKKKGSSMNTLKKKGTQDQRIPFRPLNPVVLLGGLSNLSTLSEFFILTFCAPPDSGEKKSALCKKCPQFPSYLIPFMGRNSFINNIIIIIITHLVRRLSSPISPKLYCLYSSNSPYHHHRSRSRNRSFRLQL